MSFNAISSTQCNSNENLWEELKISQNNDVWDILDTWIILSSESEIKDYISIVSKNQSPINIVSVNKLLSTFKEFNKWWESTAIVIQRNKKWFSIAIDKENNPRLHAIIDQEWKWGEHNGNDIVISNRPFINFPSINSTWNKKEQSTLLLTNDCKTELGNFNFDITYNNPILSPEEIANKVISGELNWINDVKEDNVEQIEAVEKVEVVVQEEVSLKKEHPVLKNDTIWDILQTKQFGFTETQTNLLLKKLAWDEAFLSTLKSKDINKIYPGEKIVFPEEVLNSIPLDTEVKEVNEDISAYVVVKNDTPGKIIFDNYSGANWGNIKEIMKLLNISSIIKPGQKIKLLDSITLANGKEITKKTD